MVTGFDRQRSHLIDSAAAPLVLLKLGAARPANGLDERPSVSLQLQSVSEDSLLRKNVHRQIDLCLLRYLCHARRR
jgi:hypothetical protein